MENNNNELINSISTEIWSIILYKCHFNQLQSLRSVCVIFRKSIKPQITKFRDLIGCNVLGIYTKDNVDDKSLIINENDVVCKKLEETHHEYPMYDKYRAEFYLLIKDDRPSLDDNDTILKNLRIVCFLTDNKNTCFSYYTNWRIREISNDCLKELGPGFKYIGENINEIKTYLSDNILEFNNINGDNYQFFDNEDFTYLTLILKTKRISLGIKYDCYYPETIWDML